MKTKLSKIIAKAPQKPGVYKFLDDEKAVIYVGKAKDLRKRLQSYVRPSAKNGIKTEKMIESAESVEWIETNSELEALILEDNIIKELRPKYNILLKDSKTFQYIKITIQDEYPEVTTVRKIEKDGAKYIGPKTSGSDVQHLMESVKKIFKLCSTKNISVDPKGTPLIGAKVAVKIGNVPAKRPCLDYHIKRCTGPCAGIVTPEEYKEQINQAIEFLSGDYKPAKEALTKQMHQFALEKKFERAGSLRDQIQAIERQAEKQLITDTNLTQRDVIAYVEDLGKNYFVLFQIRGGKLINQEKFVSEGGDTPGEVMESFLVDYYGRAADIPKEVIISMEIDETKMIGEFITSQTDHKVKLIHPTKGQKDKLIELAEKNARSFAQQSRVKWMADGRKGEKALEELQKALRIKESLKRIECYDISHLSGTETVGSMVVFKKGEAYKPDYRQFRLKSTVGKIDDFKSMEEVITRRLNYLPAQLPNEYKIRKAKKTDADFILKSYSEVKDFDFDIKQFYVIEKNIKKKSSIVGFGRTHKLSEKVEEIGAIWVDDKERGIKLGHHIMTTLIEKSKAKRLYLLAHPHLEDYYLRFGFDSLRDAPSELKDVYKKIIKVVGDKTQPVYMAYQKKKKDTSFESYPDLIVIDGGKGQLSTAHQVLFEKGLNVPIIGLAKREEEVFIPGKSEPIDLKKNSEAGYLLQRIRDEAHRFAIEHNRASRDKKMVKSGLDSIPGVGPKMRKKLLTYFGSVHQIKEAPQVVLEQVAGEELAKIIKENL
ncbi:excinuclease ABC subunit UvrC [Candidatus Peregrinibacteria bacterium]|nr:excinuclease ABC subunit UvrC [Candidatus Peregrinibacteria bacterium]